MKVLNKKIKVLQIMNCAASGGISAVVLNYYKAIDREKIHFDCAMTDTNLGTHGYELKNLGCEIIELPVKSKKPIAYIKKLYSILKKGNYDAIHINSNESSFYALFIALLAGVPIRIAHAHTCRNAKGFYSQCKKFFSVLLSNLLATKLVACSKEAAVSIFGKTSFKSKKLIILNNAIDVKKFKFNAQIREEVRKELNLDGKFALCCVGRMTPEKNHSFAIRIFKEILQKNGNAHLTLIGDGPLRKELERLVEDLNVSDSVSFLGNRNDLHRLLQGMDSFIMPSIYEGFGIAALEAAASGLPIYLSNTIPSVFQFYSKCHFLSLDDSVQSWADRIAPYFECERTDCYKEIISAGFDLKTSVKLFELIYTRRLKQ